jgi:hypothetical protein
LGFSNVLGPKEAYIGRAGAYTIQTIRDFLDGTGGAWDWDDFVSCPTGYPELEAVRGFWLQLPHDYPPLKTTEWCNPDGLRELRRTLKELEADGGAGK